MMFIGFATPGSYSGTKVILALPGFGWFTPEIPV